MNAYHWALRVEWRLPEREGWMPRARWGPGPWQDEPDRVEWRHSTGLPLLATRGGSGAWCGYVGLPPAHPSFGRHYDAVEGADAAHGGLTFADTCVGHICHVPEPGEHREIWWVGFDCAHAWDLAPGLAAIRRMHAPTPETERLERELEALGVRDTYRDLDYVRGTCELLANELVARLFHYSEVWTLALPRAGSLGRERWFDPLIAGWKLFFRRDLPQMWREIYLDRDWMGRGPTERELYASDGQWDQGWGERWMAAKRKDSPVPWLTSR